MEFNFNELPPKDRYRLLCNFVGPRPIALVTTMCRDGRSNAAPMSGVNCVAQYPPSVKRPALRKRQPCWPSISSTVMYMECREWLSVMI